MSSNAVVRFQSLPPLSPEEYAALEKSILDHGVLVPILVDEHGVVIDGHHRQKIALHHDLYCPEEEKPGFTPAEKRTLALSLNIDRRHLTRDQRRALVTESVKADPQLSDREHGRRTGVDHKTASKVRDELEGRGEIPHVSERSDSLGRQQPVSKPSRPQPQVEEKTRRKPLTDTAVVIGLDLGKINKRLEKLVDDDRFDRHRENIGCQIRPQVAQCLEVLGRIDGMINTCESGAVVPPRPLATIAGILSTVVSYCASVGDVAPGDLRAEDVQHLDAILDSLDVIRDHVVGRRSADR